MKTSEQTDLLFAALAAAQGEFEPIVKTLKADIKSSKADYGYSYAGLPQTLDACRPAMAKHGLSHVQEPISVDGGVDIYTRICHASGQWIEFGPLFMGGGNRPQEIGSAITYARRYQLQAAIGVAAVADDDDGAAAHASASKDSRPPARVTRPSAMAPENSGARIPAKPASEALCVGTAAPIAEGNRRKSDRIGGLAGRDPGAVWAYFVGELGLRDHTNSVPTPEQLSISQGKRIAEALANELERLETRALEKTPRKAEPGDEGDAIDVSDLDPEQRAQLAGAVGRVTEAFGAKPAPSGKGGRAR